MLPLLSHSFIQDDLLRGHLGSFGLPQELAEKPMYQLSGGQKNRVALAKVNDAHSLHGSFSLWWVAQQRFAS